MPREIPLTKGHVAIVDNADYAHLTRWKWSYSNGYAVRKVRTATGTKSLGMHQQLLQTPKGMVTDHINGDKLDNRRANLRVCTYGQNTANRPADRDNKHSTYKGVTLRKGRKANPWSAWITSGGKRLYLGVFPTDAEAAKAYNAAALRLHGEYAWLNDV